MFCHGEKECHEMEQLRQDNQQETCSRRSVVTCCFPCSSPWSAWASKRRCPGEALLLVVKVVQVVFPCVHVDSAGNVSEAKRCYLLFPLQQPLICMGLEEAMSWRSVVHCCKGCSSCFHLCPRDFLSRQRENYMRVYGFSFGRMSGESYFCSRKRVITLKRKSGL
mgnify:CR=1 FL=1